MDMFNRLNAQQQPFIRSGYGAMGKLNTLLGIGGRPQAPQSPAGPGPAFRPTPQGGVQQIVQGMQGGAGPQSSPKPNPRLNQILMLRAQNGDTEAARMLGMI